MALGAFSLLATQHSGAAEIDNVKPPFKTSGSMVVFQPFENSTPEPLPDADSANFKLIYKGNYPDKTNIASSGRNYYCNALKLPQEFNPDSASIIEESFLLANGKAYVNCKPMNFNVDDDNFAALDFPFFTDRKVVFTIKGESVDGADAATFETLENNQAKDKNRYYVIAGKSVALPYKRSASAYPPCYGLRVKSSLSKT
ncbi:MULTISPECIES: DKNYY domain-containing protein [Brenneria]|nr:MULTISPECIES: DKNYY domain-containing protein [Brenneria]